MRQRKKKGVKSALDAKYFSTLEKNPDYSKTDSYLWADYIELICLANIDGQISIDALLDRIVDRQKDLQEADPDDLSELNGLEAEDDIATRRSEIIDKWRGSAEDWFKVLEARAGTYGKDYPFSVKSGDELFLVHRLTQRHRLYLFFLFCSNLSFFEKQHQTLLSNSFEMVAFWATAGILPKSATIDLFGANALNVKGRYKTGTTLWEKINTLTQEIRENLQPRISEANYKVHNHGDDGLDIVGYIPTGDNLSSMPVFLGQCTCQKEWWKKQSESSYDVWSAKITLTTYSNNLMYIPYCFRGARGEWFNSGKISKTFLIDRKRLLHFLQGKETQVSNLSCQKILNKIILQKEAVF